jgi:LAO/AO transport system kinase
MRPGAKRNTEDINYYVDGILSGNRVVLSQAITLVESKLANHQALAQRIIEQCLPHSGRALRLGITGVPGVGKSTFIEVLGMKIIEGGGQLAVLAIDPSSQISKGSILGDKTRMERLSSAPQAYIRPSPAGDSLGGVARKTRETILLCEAAGFNHILVETVGVGQSEVTVHSMVDFFLLLLLPGAGDELQGIKRGIVEMADLLAVNKADGDVAKKAQLSAADYRNALHFYPAKESQWIPPVMTCSALNDVGVAEIWECILSYQEFTQKSGFFDQQREQQTKNWFQESIQQLLTQQFFNFPGMIDHLQSLEKKVMDRELSPVHAAHMLLQTFWAQQNRS